MSRVFRISIIVAAILALCAAPALAAGPGKSVPIHGAVLTQGPEPDMSAPGCEPDPTLMWRFSRVGTGELSHLGRVTIALTHCTYAQPDGSFAFRDGTMTFTAANGDTLVLADVGRGDVIADAGGFTGYTGEGTWMVIGGTGRFAHATGSGWFTLVGDVPGGDALFGLPDGFDRWVLGGSIAYDASDRSK